MVNTSTLAGWEIAALTSLNDKERYRSGRKQKGHRAWNKGKKGIKHRTHNYVRSVTRG